MAALAVILALGVWSAFLRVIDEPEDAAASSPGPGAAGSTTLTPTTTRTPVVVRTTTTTLGPGTTAGPITFPFTDGPCRERAPAADDSVTLLRVYFNCGNIIEPSGTTFVYRTVPQTAQRLTATLRELVKGPTDTEAGLGFGSFFTAETADAFRGVTISDGRAFIDFNPFDVPDVIATDQGRSFFVLNIAANALQYDSVTSVEIRLQGSCPAFSELIGTTGCTVITQEDF